MTVSFKIIFLHQYLCMLSLTIYFEKLVFIPHYRRRSLPLSGLSATQLADHYSSCIKLSAENVSSRKINTGT